MFEGSNIPSCQPKGNVFISCATALDLGLIQPHSELNASVPDCGRLIFSSADHPKKYQNKNIGSSSSVSYNVYVREVQYPLVSKVLEIEVNQYVTQEVQDENKQQQYPAQADTVFTRQKLSRSEECIYVATESQKL